MPHDPTPEQTAIFDAALTRSESIMINAYAGTGKSTTMEMLSHRLPPETSALALAFNKTIAVELEKRLPKTFVVKTFNGLGHSAFGKAIGKRLILDERKLGRLVTALFKSYGYQGDKEDWTSVRELTTAAMTAGLIPKEFIHYKGILPDTPEEWQILALDNSIEHKFMDFSREVLLASVKESFSGTISFDDQVYMSALFNGVFPRFPVVIVDESQDLSPLNHLQVQKSAAGRLFVVGDRKQAIYAFRGASSTSMDKLKLLRKEWVELPLHTTFRCPKVVVTRVQEHAPGYTAFHTNPEGEIIQLPHPKLPGPKAKILSDDPPEDLPTWTWAEVEPYGHDIAVLCRNNAPLLTMAFKLLRHGIGVKMLGRDIGKGLVALAKKLFPNPNATLTECVAAINHWRDLELAKARALGQESKEDGIQDKAESLLAVASHAGSPNAELFILALETLFARTAGQVTLSSGHKAKGLEWEVVVHLDPWRIPSRFAKTEAEITQEKNLRYVIETRPKKVLILADLESFS